MLMLKINQGPEKWYKEECTYLYVVNMGLITGIMCSFLSVPVLIDPRVQQGVIPKLAHLNNTC